MTPVLLVVKSVNKTAHINAGEQELGGRPVAITQPVVSRRRFKEGAGIVYGFERLREVNCAGCFFQSLQLLPKNVELYCTVRCLRLERGGSYLSGGRLTIDLDSGRAVMDGGLRGVNQDGGGRVTGRFTVPRRNSN